MPGPAFSSKPFKSSRAASKAGDFSSRYRASLSRHPFLLFGLPFLVTMVAGSFFLTPATALRYERYDHKVKTSLQENALGLKKERRQFDIREEYFRLSQKLDDDNWENKRYPRPPGDSDGIL
ncbi:cytochrome c oxidase-assembly factor mitochondrial [Mytilinidion resinicola]|uniref:Cytochrome c oxidase assembly protein COX16, mitochondrial n=1 Tax=Mytilinidion resinicola TaxID=574789 RepID=A0A6A6YYA2_9PEZI|nr:cytochrome c oxidase-assembly factor mitochondrial [Mytilinidion resinicola]KAF2813926.1 cytochrome c oxidase-assembly factor mitochondrial [Mytilinidion resinicola]